VRQTVAANKPNRSLIEKKKEKKKNVAGSAQQTKLLVQQGRYLEKHHPMFTLDLSRISMKHGVCISLISYDGHMIQSVYSA
jgi:hypothetical protein